jgi:hypothetical protein
VFDYSSWTSRCLRASPSSSERPTRCVHCSPASHPIRPRHRLAAFRCDGGPPDRCGRSCDGTGCRATPSGLPYLQGISPTILELHVHQQSVVQLELAEPAAVGSARAERVYCCLGAGFVDVVTAHLFHEGELRLLSKASRAEESGKVGAGTRACPGMWFRRADATGREAICWSDSWRALPGLSPAESAARVGWPGPHRASVPGRLPTGPDGRRSRRRHRGPASRSSGRNRSRSPCGS